MLARLLRVEAFGLRVNRINRKPTQTSNVTTARADARDRYY